MSNLPDYWGYWTVGREQEKKELFFLRVLERMADKTRGTIADKLGIADFKSEHFFGGGTFTMTKTYKPETCRPIRTRIIPITYRGTVTRGIIFGA
ncbi:MAG: hypothetical protein AABX11_05190 [Nanoarchaeota archaeon]